ncbi:unnamed protein product [Psylliodes chrysocephalus]|uniref:Uncharacterized protein n=1 Tax=Psylliodes chrysocephalus TaxID=3402493 RepID=A0A9P0GDV3_9CUCU|nr:unnamed protein product [Psylliodes chrysocephala]
MRLTKITLGTRWKLRISLGFRKRYAKGALSSYVYRQMRKDMYKTVMIWNEPMNRHDDCYFYLVKITGINRKNRAKWEYPSIQSTHRRVLSPKSTPTLQEEPEDFETKNDSSDSDFECDLRTPKPFNQDDLNALIRGLRPPKSASEILASRLKDGNERNQNFLLPYKRTEYSQIFCRRRQFRIL